MASDVTFSFPQSSAGADQNQKPKRSPVSDVRNGTIPSLYLKGVWARAGLRRDWLGPSIPLAGGVTILACEDRWRWTVLNCSDCFLPMLNSETGDKPRHLNH